LIHPNADVVDPFETVAVRIRRCTDFGFHLRTNWLSSAQFVCNAIVDVYGVQAYEEAFRSSL
jgi:hypothetical protein